MSAEFVDSNVLLYLFDETSPAKRRIAERLIDRGLRDGTCVTSYQVVQECLNVLLRKVAHPLSNEEARTFLDAVLVPLWRVMPSRTLFQRSLDVRSRHRFHFYDSLIIAAALEHGCAVLHSEDLQHNQRIDGLRVVNPFLA